MAEHERRLARPNGSVFVLRALVMEPDDVRRALVRIAHEILERNRGATEIVIVGLQTGGVPLARQLVAEITRIDGSEVPFGTIDVAFYRDDIGIRPVLPEETTDIPGDLTGRTVVLVDDVLFTGRTVRAALDALADHGRARSVQLAVMVDRGHRELPIRPDYVGKNLPTSRTEMVDVSDEGVAIGDLIEGQTAMNGRHLITVDDLGHDGLVETVRLTRHFAEIAERPIPRVPALRGKTVATLFFENSTRTRLSFETAAKRLSAETMTFSAQASSVEKGESLRDTVETIDAMGVDAMIIRHKSAGAPARVADWVSASVVNAGDGEHEHPTQALADCYTLLAAFDDPGRLDRGDLSGISVAFVGDIRHSRVARSTSRAFGLLGANITLVAPTTLLPPSLEGWDADVGHDLDAVLDTADVVYLLRLQTERMREAYFPSLREYTARFGLTRDRAARLRDGAFVMHPGPMNRGVEIEAEVASSPNALITRQVRSGVAVRMAVLFSMLATPGAFDTVNVTSASSKLANELDAVRSGKVPDGQVAASPQRVVVRGGMLVDETGERRGDVAIEDGRIVEIASTIEQGKNDLVLDASGCLVSPGLVDLHTHLREPGNEPAETIESGARAAALGGYTAVIAMPNTEPPVDSAAVVRDVRELARGACVEVAIAGAITVGRAGEQLVPFFEMAALGVRMFTDDGSGVQDPGVMRRALEYASDLDVVLAEHCEDDALAHHGHMNEGEWSSRLGIPAQPAVAEEAMVARDLALVGLTRARLHFLHLSTAGSVALVAAAKRDGLPVTEITPHHLTLTDAEVASYDPRFKMNPPLRTPSDLVALRGGVTDGTIDAIATDHAPHTQASKEAPFDEAPPGVIGLETAYAVCHGLLRNGANGAKPLSYQALVGLFSWQPAHIAGLDRSTGQGGPLVPGVPAHLCVFDPTASWVVGATPFASRSANSPFIGSTLTGRVRHTIFGGEPVVVDGIATR